MSIIFKQHADGSLGLYSTSEGTSLLRVGGPKSPTATSPVFHMSSWMKLGASGGTDTAGGLSSWVNGFAQDIIVTAVIVDVTTAATAACTVSVGTSAVSGTTSASNFVSAQDSHTATGTFVSAFVGIKVPVGTWITASVGTGASAGMVANVYIQYIVV